MNTRNVRFPRICRSNIVQSKSWIYWLQNIQYEYVCMYSLIQNGYACWFFDNRLCAFDLNIIHNVIFDKAWTILLRHIRGNLTFLVFMVNIIQALSNIKLCMIYKSNAHIRLSKNQHEYPFWISEYMHTYSYCIFWSQYIHDLDNIT
jgi:hypothetical protein